MTKVIQSGSETAARNEAIGEAMANLMKAEHTGPYKHLTILVILKKLWDAAYSDGYIEGEIQGYDNAVSDVGMNGL